MRLRRALLFASLLLGACDGGEASSVGSGEMLYVTYCRRCHGDTGQGDGRHARRVRTPPADLTALETPEADVRQVITEGRPERDMPPHALSEAELDALVPYVMSLRVR